MRGFESARNKVLCEQARGKRACKKRQDIENEVCTKKGALHHHAFSKISKVTSYIGSEHAKRQYPADIDHARYVGQECCKPEIMCKCAGLTLVPEHILMTISLAAAKIAINYGGRV